MKYDFTSIMDRRGKDAIAVDALGAPGFAPGAPKEGFDAIPMWVADMNFPTVPTIPEAIIARAAKAIGGRIVNFPVPAFFDYADTKEALWRERSVQSVLNTIDSADVALFGVGSMSARLPSHVYSGGFLDPNEIAAAQNDGVVGDVCTVLIREDGSTNMHLNERASGPSPATLKKIPRRLCVVSGASKALPLLGALRAGVATDLVLDDGAAHELLDLVHTRMAPRRSYI